MTSDHSGVHGSIGNMILLDGVMSQETCTGDIGGGSFVAFTCPSPDKETGNEDSVALIPIGNDAVVLVVADGAGGLPGGKRASVTAVETLSKTLQASIGEASTLRDAILNGIDAANRAVLDLEKDREKAGKVDPYNRHLEKLLGELTPSVSEEKRTQIEAFFWLIEEYKVSLFAQELKTSVPVSRKRLDGLIDRINRMV